MFHALMCRTQGNRNWERVGYLSGGWICQGRTLQRGFLCTFTIISSFMWMGGHDQVKNVGYNCIILRIQHGRA